MPRGAKRGKTPPLPLPLETLLGQFQLINACSFWHANGAELSLSRVNSLLADPAHVTQQQLLQLAALAPRVLRVAGREGADVGIQLIDADASVTDAANPREKRKRTNPAIKKQIEARHTAVRMAMQEYATSWAASRWPNSPSRVRTAR